MNTMTEVSEQTRIQYAGLYLIDLVSQHGAEATELIAEGESLLEPVLAWLVKSQYVQVNAEDQIELTSKGEALAQEYQEKFSLFLRDYDVFCAVDLQSGEFAFQQAGRFQSESAWEEFLEQERWEDLRVAVAESEGKDPIEMLFMSFVASGAFGADDDDGWTYDTILGSVWAEIALIEQTAISLNSLGYSDEQGSVSPEEVIKDVITQGRELAAQIRRDEA
jgi:hypothetical protein